MASAKKKKFIERGIRGARVAKGLAKVTQDRVQRALGAMETPQGYKIDNLLDDSMEQLTDVMNAVWGGGRTGDYGEVPAVFFISDNTKPERKTVSLSDSVAAGNIAASELTGIATAGPALSVIPNAGATGFRLYDPDTGQLVTAVPAARELDAVEVDIVAMPAAGSYRAFIYAGTTRLLAQIVVVRV